VRKARDEGPQVITLGGRDAVVVLSVNDFKRVATAERSLMEFVGSSPLAGTSLNLRRSRDTGCGEGLAHSTQNRPTAARLP